MKFSARGLKIDPSSALVTNRYDVVQFDVIPDAGHYPFLDQPEIFLSRMLKQTKMYLMGRGQTSDRSIQQTAIDADKEAQRIIQDNQDRKDSKRNFDL